MGKIAVVGIGPGSVADMTPRARAAIEAAEVVAGYNTYLKLIAELTAGKKIIGTGMTREIERCRAAVGEAVGGRSVAVVSSGDAGVYGMAGLVIDMVVEVAEEIRPSVEVVAGVTAVNAAAAILGAPLMHDFAVISLSDLLTPWELIEKRVRCAAEGDFVIAIYNPKSHKRVENIVAVQRILLDYRAESTPVGIVTNAGRADERKVIATLADFTAAEIDMFTLVVIGNSRTRVKAGYMVTPRGYENKI